MFSYDKRVHGKSERIASFTLDDDADDIAGLIAVYGLHKPVIRERQDQSLNNLPLIDDFLTMKLTYSDHEPLGNMRTTFLNDVFFPAVEKESRGRVKIIPHWNAKICTGYDAVKAVRSKSADLAVVVPEYDMKALPLHQLFKSFPTGPTGAEQVSFFRRVYDDVPELTREL